MSENFQKVFEGLFRIVLLVIGVGLIIASILDFVLFYVVDIDLTGSSSFPKIASTIGIICVLLAKVLKYTNPFDDSSEEEENEVEDPISKFEESVKKRDMTENSEE